jgi:hypothetical protein
MFDDLRSQNERRSFNRRYYGLDRVEFELSITTWVHAYELLNWGSNIVIICDLATKQPMGYLYENYLSIDEVYDAIDDDTHEKIYQLWMNTYH